MALQRSVPYTLYTFGVYIIQVQNVTARYVPCSTDYGKDTFSKLAKTASNDNLRKTTESTGCYIMMWFRLLHPLIVDYDVAKTEKKIYSELKGVSNTWFEIGTLLGISIRKLLTFPDQVPQDQSLCDTCLRLVIKVSWQVAANIKAHTYNISNLFI